MAAIFPNHPKGLPYLFFTEMWERFGYYLMIGIFLLYMIDTDMGGLEFPKKEASDIFGTFIALVYLTPFMGGLLADRVLGYRLSVTIGGILMGIGYMGLAIPGMSAFWFSLFLIIIGNGFFKPNISTLLGNLYNDSQYKPLKTQGTVSSTWGSISGLLSATSLQPTFATTTVGAMPSPQPASACWSAWRYSGWATSTTPTRM